MFGRHLVRTGRIEASWTKYLAGSSDDRLAADYDAGISFSTEESRLEWQRARDFVERIRQYLLANGLSEQELDEEHDNGCGGTDGCRRYRRTTSASMISTRSTGVSPSVGTASIRSTTSRPSTTTPNTV